MKFKEFLPRFEAFFVASGREELTDGSRYLILSDLHMGNGTSADDLLHNGSLLETALRDWYLPRGWILVLNGDIEDLNKFKLEDIQRAWPGLFALFAEFAEKGRLRKIVGNHDLGLLKEKDYPYPLAHSLTLERGTNRLFIFHGHQASHFFMNYDYLSEFIVRYLAKPLHIKNSSVSSNSRYRFKTERRIYRAARALGVAAVTGHTHRPLFESLSKYDSLRWSIEELLRDYAVALPDRKIQLASLIEIYREELMKLARKNEKRSAKQRRYSAGLYSEDPLLVPCLFNSGCATGKQGITALEVDSASIALAHWTAKGQAKDYMENEALLKEKVGENAHRYLLQSESLEMLFTRISLLGGCRESS